jgi:glutamine amidotransferase
LQLLFSESTEGKEICNGLNLFKGSVVRFPEKKVKIPQIGWNQISIINDHPLLEGIKNNSYYYFVHSYYTKTTENGIVLAKTQYGLSFPSIIAKDNLYATQFHPEKSSKNGLQLLKNFVKLIKR